MFLTKMPCACKYEMMDRISLAIFDCKNEERLYLLNLTKTNKE